MKARRIGYAAWLLSAACLYFFENNTGTRVVLLCSFLFPLIPTLRAALLSPDSPKGEKVPADPETRDSIRPGAEEADGIRLYSPGDPVNRIHWKLSAKKDELLVREFRPAAETAREKQNTARPGEKAGKKTRRRLAAAAAAGILGCVLLLLILPETRLGAQELCNRVFDRSEAVNRYVYRHFAVPENQGVLPAGALLAGIVLLSAAIAAILRSRLIVLGILAACTAFQVYFGLPFSGWINIPLYGLGGFLMMKQPRDRGCVLTYCGLILLVTAAVALAAPGVDAVTEEASEKIRDRLAALAGQEAVMTPEDPEAENETRHLHNRSLEYGEEEAETEQEFRLATTEEEQISIPRRFDWMKAGALLLLTAATVVLPFAPFLALNARKKQTQKNRETFTSAEPAEAVRNIFRQVILWLEATRHGAGNLLYREWSALLPDIFPEGYTERFARCAAACEETVYSSHEIPEQKRGEALELLKETEDTLWKAANRKQRIYLKYWMGLRE